VVLAGVEDNEQPPPSETCYSLPVSTFSVKPSSILKIARFVASALLIAAASCLMWIAVSAMPPHLVDQAYRSMRKDAAPIQKLIGDR